MNGLYGKQAYTVAEIDQMRAILRLLHVPRYGTQGALPLIEDELRTYMLAGVSPSELESRLTSEAVAQAVNFYSSGHGWTASEKELLVKSAGDRRGSQ